MLPECGEGDPKEWCLVLITALGSWEKPVTAAKQNNNKHAYASQIEQVYTSKRSTWYSLTVAFWAQSVGVPVDGIHKRKRFLFTKYLCVIYLVVYNHG
jgi:hypothetical protein